MSVLPTERWTRPRAIDMATIAVMGNDCPGIVKEVTSAVASQGIDILTVESEVLSAPFSGAEMFQLQMVVAVPEGTSMIMGREVLIVKLSGVEESFQNLDIQVRARRCLCFLSI